MRCHFIVAVGHAQIETHAWLSQKMFGPIGIHNIRVYQASNYQFRPGKHVLPGGTIRWNQVIQHNSTHPAQTPSRTRAEKLAEQRKTLLNCWLGIHLYSTNALQRWTRASLNVRMILVLPFEKNPGHVRQSLYIYIYIYICIYLTPPHEPDVSQSSFLFNKSSLRPTRASLNAWMIFLV